MDRFILKGYEIIIYPSLLTIIRGCGLNFVLSNAGNSLEKCRDCGIRQVLNFYIYDSKHPMWLYWNGGEMYNPSAEMVDLLRLRDRVKIIKEDIGYGFTLFTSLDILYAEPSPNTDYYESIYDGAILSYRANGCCSIQPFERCEVNYQIFLESISSQPIA